jgi:hypothetical protein
MIKSKKNYQRGAILELKMKAFRKGMHKKILVQK